jgi:hypothetical protein
MRNDRWTILLVLVMLLAAGGQAIHAQGNLPAFGTLDPGWNVITPGGATRCSDGTAYSFLVRPGTVNRLLIYFQGGGACWDTNTCINLTVFDPNVTDEIAEPVQTPSYGQGIFDLTNPANPFANYTIVYVPYCSGDFHMGSTRIDYPTTPGNTVLVTHRGAINARAALDWVYDNLWPQSIFMTGCSAGGPAAIFHAGDVAPRYPGVPLVALSDSAGGYQGNLAGLFRSWGTAGTVSRRVPGLQGQSAADLSFEAITRATAAANPGAQFAAFNSTADDIQPFYLGLMGTDPARYEGVLLENLLSVHTVTPNFRSFTSRDNFHCITPRPAFYDLSVNGTRVRDWVDALANGGQVWDVYPEGFNLWFAPPG